MSRSPDQYWSSLKFVLQRSDVVGGQDFILLKGRAKKSGPGAEMSIEWDKVEPPPVLESCTPSIDEKL